MKYRRIVIIALVASICLMTGCRAAGQWEDIENDNEPLYDAYLESADDNRATLTDTTSAELQETYGPSDIRTRVPEVGDIYYTEQLIEESKDEALELTQEILDNPGKVFLLGEGYANPLEVLLDVDSDGVPDRVSLSIQGESRQTYLYKEIDGIPYVKWELYTLTVNDSVTEIGFWGAKETGPYRWNILVFSPDGERILLALTEAVSEEELQGNWTDVFAYQNGEFTEVLSETIDLLGEHTVIGKDNLVAWRIPFSPFESRVLFEWKVDENGVYQRHYEEMYDYLDECTAMVVRPIVIYEEPDPNSKKIATIDQQMVAIKKSEMVLERDYEPSAFMFGKAKNWIYLETMDGISGWIQVGDAVQLADGEWEEVFLVFTSGNSGW